MTDRDDPLVPEEPPIEAAPAVAETERLAADLAAAREEAERYRERWVRERADLENLRKRADRERSEAVRFGTERLVADLLGIVDDLERAIRAAEDGAGGAALLDGVRLVGKSLFDVLARHGVTRVEAQGQAFDPAHHEAVAHLSSEEHGAGMVIEEHRGGFRLNDRLLRPALVSVSKGPPSGN